MRVAVIDGIHRHVRRGLKHNPRVVITCMTFRKNADCTTPLVGNWDPDSVAWSAAVDLGDSPANVLPMIEEQITNSEAEQQKLPNAAQNNNTKAVRLMLEAGCAVLEVLP